MKATRFLVPALSTFLLLPSLFPGASRAGTAVPSYSSPDNRSLSAPMRRANRLNVYQRDAVQGFLTRQAVVGDTLRLLALQVQFSDSLMRADRDSTWFANELRHLTEYYDGASRQNLSVVWQVTSRVYDLPKEMGYYGDDPLEDIRGVELMQSVIDSADADEDFSLYDTFMIIHAQPGQETDIFDNSRDQIFSTFFDRVDINAAFEDSTVFGLATSDSLNGQPFSVDNFMIVPEDASQDDIIIGSLGIWAFETGSRVGMLPLFDSTPEGFPDSRGVGELELMSYGLFNAQGFIPAFPSAFNRMIAGWVDAIEVTADGSFRLHDINTPAPGDTALLRIPITESEYFLVSNRVHDTNFDSLFTFNDSDSNLIPDNTDSLQDAEFDWFLTDFTNPFIVKFDPNTGVNRRFVNTGSGIYIWHVDESVIRQAAEAGELPNDFVSRKGVDLEEADGIQDMDNMSGPFVFGSHFDSYRDGNNAAFGPSTNPRSWSNTFAPTGISVLNISAVDSFMTCDVQISIPYTETRTRWMAPARYQPPSSFNLNAAGAKELVAFADTGRVYAFNADGTEFLDRDSDPSTIEPYFSAPGAMWVGAPAFGNIDGGADQEIVATSLSGNVYAWKGDSTEVFDGDNNPATNGILYQGGPIAAPPMLVDINNDSSEDIALVESIGDSLLLHFIDATGSAVIPIDPVIQATWPPRIQAQYCAPLAYGAVGKTGNDTEGVVMAWADTIRGLYGISVFPTILRSGTTIARETVTFKPLGDLDMSLFPLSSPAVGDLNGDGFDAVAVTVPDGRLLLFEPSVVYSSTTTPSPTPPAIPLSYRFVELRKSQPSAPALGDVDGNGTMEIALFDDENFYVFENNGRLRTNWPQPTRPADLGEFPPLMFDNRLVSPLIGNIDDNSGVEVLFPFVDGTIYGFSADGSLLSGYPRAATAGIAATPLVDDLGSGELTWVSLGAPGLLRAVDAVFDSLLVDDTVVLSIQSLPGSTTSGPAFWMSYQQDNSRRGRVAPATAQPNLSSLTEPNSFIVYPNPARDTEVHARIILNSSATVDVEIYNLEGEKALSQHFRFGNAGGGVQTPFDEPIDISRLASGLYMMRLAVSGSGGSQTLIKTFAVLR